MLRGQRVLLIAPSFFDYEKDIICELEGLGAKVDFFDERPFQSSFLKILIRLGLKFLVSKSIIKYFQGIIEQCLIVKYDFLLVISPETMPEDFLIKLKEISPDTKKILYMWDSIANKSASSIIPFFDKIFTFDKEDASSIKNACFLPLFYSFPSNLDFLNVDSRKRYFLSFIGTVHSDRVCLIEKLFRQLGYENENALKYLYCPSKLLFTLKKTFTNEFDDISLRDVTFSKLNRNEVLDIFSDSKIIIDIHHPGQKGLTMRTLEVIGLQRKLITTNEDVVHYDFFNPSNILVIDRYNPVIPDSFINSEYSPLDCDILNSYSLRTWVCKVFDCTPK